MKLSSMLFHNMLRIIFVMSIFTPSYGQESEDEDFLAFIRTLEAELGPNAEKLVSSDGEDSSRDVPGHLIGAKLQADPDDLRSNFLTSYAPSEAINLSRYGQQPQAPKLTLPKPYGKAATHYLETLTKRLQKIESFLAALPRRAKRLFSNMVSQVSQKQVNYTKTIKDIVSNLKKINDKKSYKISIYDPGFAAARDLIIRYVEKISPLLKRIVLPKNLDAKLSLTTEQSLEDLAQLIAYDFAQLDTELKNILEHGKKPIEELKAWREGRQQQIKDMFARKNFGRLQQKGLSRYRQRRVSQRPQPYYGPRARPRGYGSGYGRGYGRGGYAPYNPQQYRGNDRFGKKSSRKPAKKPTPKTNVKDNQQRPDRSEQNRTRNKDLQAFSNKIMSFQKIVTQAQKTRKKARSILLEKATKLKAEIDVLDDNFDKKNSVYKQIRSIYDKALIIYTNLMKNTADNTTIANKPQRETKPEFEYEDLPTSSDKTTDEKDNEEKKEEDKNNENEEYEKEEEEEEIIIQQKLDQRWDDRQELNEKQELERKELLKQQEDLEAQRIALKQREYELREQFAQASSAQKEQLRKQHDQIQKDLIQNQREFEKKHTIAQLKLQEQYDVQQDALEERETQLIHEQRQKTRDLVLLQEQLKQDQFQILEEQKLAIEQNKSDALVSIQQREQELMAMDEEVRRQLAFEKIKMQQRQKEFEARKREQELILVNFQSEIDRKLEALKPKKTDNAPVIIHIVDEEDDEIDKLEKEIDSHRIALEDSDNNGNGALHFVAAKPKKIKQRQLLIDKGAALNAENDLDQTVHVMATVSKNPQALEDFLRIEDRNVNFQDVFGNTALHYALLNRDFASSELLLARGASIHIRNNAGVSPLDIVNEYQAVPHQIRNQEQYRIQAGMQQVSQSVVQQQFANDLAKHSGTYVISGGPHSPRIMTLTSPMTTALAVRSYPMLEQAPRQQSGALTIVSKPENQLQALWFNPASKESFLSTVGKIGHTGLQHLIVHGAPISRVRTQDGAIIGVSASDIVFEPLLLEEKTIAREASRAIERAMVMVNTVQKLANNDPAIIQRARKSEVLINTNKALKCLAHIEDSLALESVQRNANCFVPLVMHQDMLRCMAVIGALDSENKQFATAPIHGWWAHQEQYIQRVGDNAGRGGLYALGLDSSREAMLCWKSHQFFNVLTNIILGLEKGDDLAELHAALIMRSAITINEIIDGLSGEEVQALLHENSRYIGPAQRMMADVLPNWILNQPGWIGQFTKYMGLGGAESQAPLVQQGYRMIQQTLSMPSGAPSVIDLHQPPQLARVEPILKNILVIVSSTGQVIDIDDNPLDQILIRQPLPEQKMPESSALTTTFHKARATPTMISLQTISGNNISPIALSFLSFLKKERFQPFPTVKALGYAVEIQGETPREIEQSHAIITTKNNAVRLVETGVMPMIELYEKARMGDTEAEEQLRKLYQSPVFSSIKLNIDQMIKYNRNSLGPEAQMFGFFASGVTSGITQYFGQVKYPGLPFMPGLGIGSARFANTLMFPFLGLGKDYGFAPQNPGAITTQLGLEACVEREVNKQIKAGGYMLGIDSEDSKQAAIEVALRDFDFAIKALNKQLNGIVEDELRNQESLINFTYQVIHDSYYQFVQGFKVFPQKDILAWLNKNREIFTELLQTINATQKRMNTEFDALLNQSWFSKILSYVGEISWKNRDLLLPETYNTLETLKKKTYFNDVIDYKLKPLLGGPDAKEQARLNRIRDAEIKKTMKDYQRMKREMDRNEERFRRTQESKKKLSPPSQPQKPAELKPSNPNYKAGADLFKKLAGSHGGDDPRPNKWKGFDPTKGISQHGGSTWE